MQNFCKFVHLKSHFSILHSHFYKTLTSVCLLYTFIQIKYSSSDQSTPIQPPPSNPPINPSTQPPSSTHHHQPTIINHHNPTKNPKSKSKPHRKSRPLNPIINDSYPWRRWSLRPRRHWSSRPRPYTKTPRH